MSTVNISQPVCLSHLDPHGGKVLARKLELRLQRKLDMDHDATGNSLFLTLTFDRKPYGGDDDPTVPRKLWDEAVETNGHIKLFMRRLARLTGGDFKGKWFAKREFQDGGYLHYHVLLYDVKLPGHRAGFLPKPMLDQAWGLGHTRFDPVDPGTARYLAKYEAKAGRVPGWMYDLPGRSIRMTSASPGFWKGVDPPPRKLTTPVQRSVRPWRSDEPMWVRIERARSEVVLRPHNGKSIRATGNAAAAGLVMVMLGCPCMGEEHGGMTFEGSIQDAKRAVHQSSQFIDRKEYAGITYTSVYSQDDHFNPTQSQERSGGSAAALLDQTDKNGYTQTHHLDDPSGQKWGESTRYPSQIEVYGADVLHCIDPDYLEHGHTLENS